MAQTCPINDASTATSQDAPAPVVALWSLARLGANGSWRIALPHAQDDHLLIWVTRGQGLALIDGVRRGVGANNVIWLPAGTQFAIDASPQTFGQVLSVSGVEPALLPTRPQHLRVRDVTFQGELSGLIELIQREVQEALPFQTDALLAKFRLVEVWMRRMMLHVGEPEDRVHLALPDQALAARQLSQQFAALAEAQFRGGQSMADYALALGVTPTHLSRVTREIAGMTAADLLTARVLHEARRLLEDTTVPAQNIAAHLGFGSAAYFSRFIQKHTGAAPSQLRAAR